MVDEAEELIELRMGDRLELIATGKSQQVFLRTNMLVEIEVIGGGGGGGGSTKGGSGGSGGRPGGYLYIEPTTLPAGTYTVDVGKGGIGGMVKKSYDDGANDYAQPGTLSRIYKMGGAEIANVAGGAAGKPNQTNRADGDPGHDLVNNANVLISHGGSGGPRDYAGGTGEFPGAGGGGGGVFIAGGSSRTGSGGNGRIIMHAIG